MYVPVGGEFTFDVLHKVGRCRLSVSNPELKAPMAWSQRLNLQYDEPLANFAFNSTCAATTRVWSTASAST